MYWSSQSPVHQARELLNLVRLARWCAELPNVDDGARRAWHARADRAWAMVQPLLPTLHTLGAPGLDVLAVAEEVAGGVKSDPCRRLEVAACPPARSEYRSFDGKGEAP